MSQCNILCIVCVFESTLFHMLKLVKQVFIGGFIQHNDNETYQDNKKNYSYHKNISFLLLIRHFDLCASSYIYIYIYDMCEFCIYIIIRIMEKVLEAQSYRLMSYFFFLLLHWKTRTNINKQTRKKQMRLQDLVD